MKKKSSKTFSYQTRIVTDPLVEEVLDAMGSIYGCMERHLFKDILAKTSDINTIKRTYLIRFGVTARQFNGCLRVLQGKIESLRQIRKNQILHLKETCAFLKKKVSKIKKPFIKHQKNRRLHALLQKQEKLEEEAKEGKVSLCFGSKKLFHAQFDLEANGYGSLEEWKKDWCEARSSEFFFIGSKDETGGNQSCLLDLSEGNGSLRIRIPNALASKYGKYLRVPISFTYGKDELIKAIACKKALNYRLKKDKKGWRVFVSFEHEETPIVTKQSLGALGIDINIDHIALVEIDAKGNPIDKKTLPLCTYGKTKNQTKALVGDTIKKIIGLSKEKQKPIIREDLDFSRKKATLREGSAKRSRMLSSFHYSYFIQNLEAKAFREGLEVFSVNPAMTSIIGKMKFAKRYGLSVHHGAALTIARRHYHFSESPSKSPMKIVHKHFHVTCPQPERNRRQHVWKTWKEVDRKLKAVLAALFRNSPDPQFCRSG